ncbi:MAG TPA: hypothetical protein VM689_20480 [Aliidongia sp.]|nr:hypothetical protein [Aliidongia sp.]
MELFGLDPVADQEILGRILFEPDDWLDGKLTPRAISTQDLSDPDRGWSVQRVQCSPHLIRIVAEDRIRKRPQLKVDKVALFDALAVRRLNRGVTISPHPTLSNEAHAIVLGPPGEKRSVYKQIKADLIDLLNDINSLDETIRMFKDAA